MNTENYHIGGADLKINGTSVGGTTTNGVTVSYSPSIHMHNSSQYGDTPVKASFLGAEVTITAEIQESTKINLEKVLSGTTSAGGKIKLGGTAGSEILGVELTVEPFDGTFSWTMRNAIVNEAVEVAYGTENERIYSVTFMGLIDTSAPEGEEIGYIS